MFPKELQIAWSRSLDEFRREAEMESSGVAVESFRSGDRRFMALCVTGEQQVSDFLETRKIERSPEKNWMACMLVDLLVENLSAGHGLSVEVLESEAGETLALLWIATTEPAVRALIDWFQVSLEDPLR